MTRRLRPVLLLSTGVLLVACAAALNSERSRVPEPPRPVSSDRNSVSPVVSASSPHPSALPLASAADILRDFRPLVSGDEYAEVRLARDAGEMLLAAQSAALIADTAKNDAEARHFFAALLAQEAGELRLALGHFRQAAQSGGPLREEATLRAAELSVAVGSVSEARSALASLETLRATPRAKKAMVLALVDDASPGDVRAALNALGEVGGPEFARELALRLEKRLGKGATSADSELQGLLLSQTRRGLLGLREGSPEEKRLLKLRTALAERLGVPPGVMSDAEWVTHLTLLEASRDFEAVVAEVGARALAPTGALSTESCEALVLHGRALAGLRKWGEAFEAVDKKLKRCDSHPDLHAKLLFNAGKYAGADGREARAGALYEELERRYPTNSLADDARVKRAQSALDAGNVARFTELLLKAPDDYPDGDMTMEGVFLLALHRMERRDWGGAALILERGARVVRSRDVARGQEFSGTERYFLARAKGELGDVEFELAEYEEIVRNYPLSYYMLHAFSRLNAAEPARAQRALDEGRKRAALEPFSFPTLEPENREDFLRGVELLRVGAFGEGEALLQSQLRDASGPALWALARIFEKAGDSRIAHDIARRRLSDWLLHYPDADWRTPWEIGFPRPHLEVVEKVSSETGVPPWFIYGIMREESLFDAKAESPARAYGLMQLIEPTARNIGVKEGLAYSRRALLTPSSNIALGARVLRNLTKQFTLNPWLAIPGYNAGPGRPLEWLKKRPDLDFDVWVELIPFRETRRYTKRVLASRAAYALVYYPDSAEKALLLPKNLKLPE